MDTTTKKTELATTGQVKNVLLISAEKSDIVISNAIKAQLQVISAIEHPELFESAFDLMPGRLELSIESAPENMKRDFQRKGAAMVNSMLFFIYENEYQHIASLFS
jgi:hypothetical protein